MALFDVRELVNMAVKDEETGVAFYTALAEVTKVPEIKDGVLAIAKQEEFHRDRFKKILHEIGDYRPQEEYPGQYEEYVKVLLESRAFPEPEKAAEKARSVGGDTEALDIALQLEKDTLLFLQEMKSFVRDSESAYIQEIIEEERAHVVDLTMLKRKLG